MSHTAQIKAAQLARHADGDALVGADEDIGEGRRQQRGLLHRVIIVIDKIDGVGVDVAEELGADGGEPGLGRPAGRPGHVARIDLAEVALGIDERVQQRAVALGKADHRVVDRGVAVGVQAHRLSDDVRALRARAGEKPHLVHRIEELSVRGLEAVDLRDGARDNDGHRVGHVVRFQRLGDVLLHHVRVKAHHIRVCAAVGLLACFVVLLHSCTSKIAPAAKMAADHTLSNISYHTFLCSATPRRKRKLPQNAIFSPKTHKSAAPARIDKIAAQSVHADTPIGMEVKR